MYDLILRHGEVLDGSGRQRYRADVAVSGDQIAAVGNLADAPTGKQIDATGKMIAPGFIDVHNHSDGWLLKTPHLTAKTLQGFTTEVLMADGISYAPVDERTAPQWMYYLRSLNGLRMDEYRGWRTWQEYMEQLDGANVQNAAAHVPYANIRSLARGFRSGRVDDYQMREVQRQIHIAMEAGAVGLSTGLDYIVQCFSDTDELVEACAALRPYNGLYVTHVRYKKGLLPALREAVEIGERAEVAVHISHLKPQTPAETDTLLDYIDNEARRRVDFSFDSYPYQPGSTMLNYLLPYDAWQHGPLAAAARLTEPDVAAQWRAGIEAYRLDIDQIHIAWVAGKENAVHQGKSLRQYVSDHGGSTDRALLDLLLEERLAVLCVMHEGEDETCYPILTHDLHILGSDGIYQQDGPVHPRVFGSAGRLLGRCVRDYRLFSLEDAVARLSGRPATRFGLKRRGFVREGYFADLVVFDAERIHDPADYVNPRQPTVGIEHVLVNGQRIVAAGAPVDQADPLPGRFLRFQPGE